MLAAGKPGGDLFKICELETKARLQDADLPLGGQE